MVKLFIGIDISKDWIDYSTFQSETKTLVPGDRVENNSAKIRSFLKKFTCQNSGIHVVFEHTGVYGLELSMALEKLDIPYSVVPANEIKMSIGVRRGKSDVVDAARIAEYAGVNSHKLKTCKLPSKKILSIKQLLAYRSQLRKLCSSLKNSMKPHKANAKLTGLNDIIKDIWQKIEALEKDIESIEMKITRIIESEDGLSRNFNYLKSVKGVGSVIAAHMLVITGNFSNFDDPRKFNCYAGLAPFEHSSGSSIRGRVRTSHLANKEIKTLLSNGVNSAIMYDPQIKKYYQRKLNEGKEKKVIKNAVACKLVYRMFAVIKRQSNYVILAN